MKNPRPLESKSKTLDTAVRSNGGVYILLLIGLVLGVWFYLIYFHFNPENLSESVLDREVNPLLQAEASDPGSAHKLNKFEGYLPSTRTGSGNSLATNTKNGARNRGEDYTIKGDARGRQSSGRTGSSNKQGGLDGAAVNSTNTGRKGDGKAEHLETVQKLSQAKTDYASRATGSGRSTNAQDDGFGDDEADDALEQDDNGIPQGEYTISGQVLNEAGKGVPAVKLLALVRRLFDTGKEFNAANNMAERHALTDASGYFQFPGLANGDYEIRTVATNLYPSVNAMLRTGSDSVKLTVVEQRRIWVFGQITSSEGEPLADVEIALSGAEEPAYSDADGNYGLYLNVRGDRSYSIPFRAEGYRDQKLMLQRNDWHDNGQVELHVVMEPAKVLTTVAGVVRSKTGAAVPDERVYIQSRQRKYKSTTDANGNFLIKGVEAGGNYALWLMPQGAYKKYREERLTVPPAGLSGLEVVLEPVTVGSLVGQMVDTKGNTVPNFTLLVRSEAVRNSRFQVTSDHEGNFAVENLPAGRVRFETTSFPRFIVSGIQLVAGAEQEKVIVLVLDVGNQETRGRVLDSRGNPIPGADITLSWVLRDSGLVHESMRKTKSLADGNFSFNQLGDVIHDVIVRAPGYQVANLEQGEAFESLEVRLEPLEE